MNIFKETIYNIFRNPMIVFIIILAAFSAGISIQQYWIFENCAEQIQKISNACKDNHLRIILGGPVFVIPMFLLFIFISMLLFRLTIDDKTEPRILLLSVQKKLSLIFLVFLLWEISVGLNFLKPLIYISFFLFVLLCRIYFPAQMSRLWNIFFPEL